jgi:hydrogenase/urease accessory protein HupE
MQHQQGTRRRPGPVHFIGFHFIGFIITTLACFFLGSSVVRAHDPGLSALDIRVHDDVVSAQLSIAAPDVALMTSSHDSGGRLHLSEFVRDSVRLAVDGVPLPVVVDDVSIEEGAARVQLSFAMAPSRPRSRRLTIASDVPNRVARGHRELLIVSAGGRIVTEKLLDSSTGSVAIDLEAASPSAAHRAWQFLTVGVRHILTGYDHLVFLAGLLLAARSARELVVGLTTFTAAHSLSLALVVIAGVHAPPAIVEPIIAASIAWVGLENLIPGRPGLRLLVVFGFGLIHGLGFAEALIELGLGSSAAETTIALLSFNSGVEAGQLAVALMLMPVVWTIRSRPSWAARLLPVCSALIVLAGGYWLIERLR